MTVAEMKISNRERLNKLEALDPEKLNDILDYVFSNLVCVSKENTNPDENHILEDEFPSWFGIWKDNGDEIKECIMESRKRFYKDFD